MSHIKQAVLFLLFSIITAAAYSAEISAYNRASYQVTQQQEVTNDEITVTMAIERNNPDATKLSNEINKVIISANKTIHKFTSIKSSTSDYSIQPVYTRDRQLDHWRGISSITLKGQNFKDMTELVQQLQKILLIKSTRYNVSAARKDKIETGMIDTALKKFNARAALVSKSMGFKKYRLVNININNTANAPRPVFAMASTTTALNEMAPPTFDSGQSTLKVVVSGTIQMEVGP